MTDELKSGARIINKTANAELLAKSLSIPLPSKGVLYEGRMPTGSVRIRPMTTAEEAILYSPVGDGLTKIHAIINACVIDKDVPPDELLLIDRFAILLALRTLSLGPIYTVPFRCRYCSAQFKATIDIAADLDMVYMDEGVKEPFIVSLPKANKLIGFRLLRGRDEERIAKYTKKTRMKSTDTADPSYLYRMALQIINIDGVDVKIEEAEKFVKTLDIGDSNALRQEVEKVEGGIDTTIYIDCTSCGATNETEMPFELEFFRPSIS